MSSSMIAVQPTLSTSNGHSRSAQKRAIRDAQARLASAEAEKWTPFRAAEKAYMVRGPGIRPDLSRALDLALLNNGRVRECETGGWAGSSDALPFREIPFASQTGHRRAYVLPDIPGLVVLSGFLSHEDQRVFVRWALADHARPPNETNLDTHYILPTTGIWSTSIDPLSSSQIVYPRTSSAAKLSSRSTQSTRRTLIENTPASPSSFATLAATPKPPASASASLAPVPAHELVHKLRWANVGWFYHWGEKQYDFSRPKVPVHERVAAICKQAVRGVDWAEVFDGSQGAWPEGDAGWSTWADDYEPDAGIVNYYQTKDTLMGHVDRSEVCATAPLVSISLGLSAVFLIGGMDRSTSSPHALVLRSGDALIMAGPRCRRVFHGIPRVLENSLPAHLDAAGDETWIPYADYLAHARINVNVRQVFPKGFNPSMNAHTS